ncbi:MAG: eCIS core domain-containing protein [Pseudonocardiaceae bacterium]
MDVRADVESRLGHDFADVQVHTESRAHDSARVVKAHANTVGSNIAVSRYVQRCGGIQADKCPCHSRDEHASERNTALSNPDVQRDESTKASQRSQCLPIIQPSQARPEVAVTDSGQLQLLPSTAVLSRGAAPDQIMTRPAQSPLSSPTPVWVGRPPTIAFRQPDPAPQGDGDITESTVLNGRAVPQRSAGGGRRILQRWALGAAPAPPAWDVVTNPAHIARVKQAEAVIRGVLTSPNCQNYFRGKCTKFVGANALQQAFDSAMIYHRPDDDNVFGESDYDTSDIAYNRRSFRIGHFMMASTLLHELFHTCKPTPRGVERELAAENAVEACRLYTPWIDSINPRSGGYGTRVTIVGWGFGPTQQSVDEVRIAGMGAAIVSWDFLPDNSSRVRIVAEVPGSSGGGAGAGASSDIVVINNGVPSNAVPFRVT